MAWLDDQRAANLDGWREPLRNADAQTSVPVYEWWNGARKLTVYLDAEGPVVLRVAEDGDVSLGFDLHDYNADPPAFTEHWGWLCR